jgi:hypothetical protein
MEAPAAGSLVGFSEDKAAAVRLPGRRESAPAPAPVALPPTMGVVKVRSTPYLSEVFVRTGFYGLHACQG